MRQIGLVLGLCVVVLVGCKKRENTQDSTTPAPAAVTIKATFDSTGQHPGTAAVAGPTKLTCLRASGINGKCYVVAPGVNNIMAPGTTVGTGGPGTVTLNCNGTGNYLECYLQVG